jgi:hypothetical protein
MFAKASEVTTSARRLTPHRSARRISTRPGRPRPRRSRRPPTARPPRTEREHDGQSAAHDLGPGTGQVLALVQAVIALVVAFGLNLAPDQIGAILAVTAVILGLITRSRVSPVS